MSEEPARGAGASPQEPQGEHATRSQENEELVRWGYEWFNLRREPPPTWLPEGEFVNSSRDPDHGVYRGIEAIRRQNQGWFDAYPDLTVQPLEVRANGETVFTWARFSGHGADSGAGMEMELAHVLEIEQGRLRRLTEYLDRGEALAASGLDERSVESSRADDGPRGPDLVVLTRWSMERTNAGDYENGVTALFAPDAVFDMSAAGLGRFEGIEAVRGYLEDWIGLFDEQTFGEWEGEALGDGVVLVTARLDGILAGSNTPVQERWAFAVVWSGPLIERVVATQDVRSARAVAETIARERG